MARYLEKSLFPVLRKLGIVLYAYSPLAGGFLSKSLTDLDAGAGRFDKDVMGRMYNNMYNKLSLREGLKLWSAIAEKEGVTKAELAYRWVAHHSALTDTDGIVFWRELVRSACPDGREYSEVPLERRSSGAH